MAEPAGGVTTIELFFDLVFVFTITQLTGVVAEDPSVASVARAMLIFGNLWWMYGGYVWLTNTVPPVGDRERILLLVGMGGFLVTALGIPSGFGPGGVVLGVGYLIVNLVHAGLLLGPVEGSVLHAMGRLGPANIATASLILLAGFTHGTLTWVLWTVAFVAHWVTPYLTDPTAVTLQPRHFAERHGLIVLIALGESLFAVGIGVGSGGVDGLHLVLSLAALVLIAGLWWLYFDRDDEAAVAVLDAAPGARRNWLALHAYGYAFLPLIGGIIVFAGGLRREIAAAGEPVPTAVAALLALGAAVYVLGLSAVRARFALGPLRYRIALALAAVPTILVGTTVGPAAQIAVLGVLVVAASLGERRGVPAPA